MCRRDRERMRCGQGGRSNHCSTKQASDAAALAAYARRSAAIYDLEGLNQSGSYPRANTLPLNSTVSTYDAWMDPAILTTGGDISQTVRSWGHGGSGISDSASVALKPSYKPGCGGGVNLMRSLATGSKNDILCNFSKILYHKRMASN
ncbi:hypothetical protein O6H91_07G100800 [Diphasiastrum complanatum]|uniref:Uncharacterized protein n=1 Tax=Diphasiastrum complanatum TaxID=34168 RepID=A0ACC2D8B1_DIPCM|nr:hypothetical protein O6H91_07G100800 [Diphasiastrum complanatum]